MVDAEFLKTFETYLEGYVERRSAALSPYARQLTDAVRYALFSGGKRFRPGLVGAMAQSLQMPKQKVLPWAAAIEMIHTYSLIHDDLPCMDNDDLRRGKPTTHKKFNEATALLAGDALLTEAFLVIAAEYKNDNALVAIELVELLAKAAGLSGMVAGQVEDLAMSSDSAPKGTYKSEVDPVEMFQLHNLISQRSDEEQKKVHTLLQMHIKKTGALICAALLGVGIIAKLDSETKTSIEKIGYAIGLAFQLTDDLLDFDPAKVEKSGLPSLVGVENTKLILQQVSREATKSLRQIQHKLQSTELLVNLIEVNESRTN